MSSQVHEVEISKCKSLNGMEVTELGSENMYFTTPSGTKCFCKDIMIDKFGACDINHRRVYVYPEFKRHFAI